jgi:hypothetical protein
MTYRGVTHTEQCLSHAARRWRQLQDKRFRLRERTVREQDRKRRSRRQRKLQGFLQLLKGELA